MKTSDESLETRICQLQEQQREICNIIGIIMDARNDDMYPSYVLHGFRGSEDEYLDQLREDSQDPDMKIETYIDEYGHQQIKIRDMGRARIKERKRQKLVYQWMKGQARRKGLGSVKRFKEERDKYRDKVLEAMKNNPNYNRKSQRTINHELNQYLINAGWKQPWGMFMSDADFDARRITLNHGRNKNSRMN